jgi:hypothetical protein
MPWPREASISKWSALLVEKACESEDALAPRLPFKQRGGNQIFAVEVKQVEQKEHEVPSTSVTRILNQDERRSSRLVALRSIRRRDERDRLAANTRRRQRPLLSSRVRCG